MERQLQSIPFGPAFLLTGLALSDFSKRETIVSQATILGGAFYNNPQFKALMNSNYYPLDAMKRSVAKLKAASDQIHLETLEYGQYQSILTPKSSWPAGGGAAWLREMGHARLDLTAQRNTVELDGVVPLTRCALLDASLRKCFNSDPPICMKIDVREHKFDDANADKHDIELTWTYGDGKDKPPTLLEFTMICPFRGVAQT
jgi:hypothetical protein